MKPSHNYINLLELSEHDYTNGIYSDTTTFTTLKGSELTAFCDNLITFEAYLSKIDQYVSVNLNQCMYLWQDLEKRWVNSRLIDSTNFLQVEQHYLIFHNGAKFIVTPLTEIDILRMKLGNLLREIHFMRYSYTSHPVTYSDYSDELTEDNEQLLKDAVKQWVPIIKNRLMLGYCNGYYIANLDGEYAFLGRQKLTVIYKLNILQRRVVTDTTNQPLTIDVDLVDGTVQTINMDADEATLILVSNLLLKSKIEPTDADLLALLKTETDIIVTLYYSNTTFVLKWDCTNLKMTLHGTLTVDSKGVSKTVELPPSLININLDECVYEFAQQTEDGLQDAQLIDTYKLYENLINCVRQSMHREPVQVFDTYDSEGMRYVN